MVQNSDFFSRTILVDIFVHFVQKAYKVNLFSHLCCINYASSFATIKDIVGATLGLNGLVLLGDCKEARTMHIRFRLS